MRRSEHGWHAVAAVAVAAAAACGVAVDRGAGTLVAAMDSDPGHLNPAITTSGSVHTASELLYNGLVELSPALEPVPGLAREWEVEDGGRLYRFHLRPGVEWHDGEPFSATDVVYSFREVLLRYHSRTRASLGSALDSVVATDSLTVEFHFSDPYAPLLAQLNVHEAPLVAEHLYAGTDPRQNPHNLEPVGTGPFRFDGYDRGAEIRLRRNPRYFEEGAPKLDRVVLRVIPDPGSQLLAFEAGEVDWLFGVPGPDRARLAADPGVRFLETTVNPGGANCIMTLTFNLERPALRDERVRRAIAHALDRTPFLERILFGQGRIADAPISSGIGWAHADGLGLPVRDPDRARGLLDRVGWVRSGSGAGLRVARGVAGVRDGTPLVLTFLHFPAYAAYGELLRAQLRAVGIGLRPIPLEPAIFVRRVFEARDFDTNVISYCNGLDPEIGVRRMYVTSNIAPIPFSNGAAYSDPRVDSLFDAARRTVDRTERARIYREVQGILVEALPYLWLVETRSTRAHRSGCSGFRPSGHFAERAECED